MLALPCRNAHSDEAVEAVGTPDDPIIIAAEDWIGLKRTLYLFPGLT